MEYKEIAANTKLHAIDWEGVRPIYRQLSEEFHILTGAYNIILNKERELMLDHLIIVIDEVDACIDSIKTKNLRDKITESLIDFLLNEEIHWSDPNATKSLANKMEIIKVIVYKENIVMDFVNAAKDIFYFTEIKRHTEDKNELITYIMNEGAATAKMPLSVLKIPSDHEFYTFFTGLCTLMGIADLVVDARSDYKEGLLVLKPSILFSLRLSYICTMEGFKLFWNFPKKLSFFLYCLRFGFSLLKGN